MADNLKGIPFSTNDEGVDHILAAKQFVVASVPDRGYTIDEVYVVSFMYVLGNWKALVSSSHPDGLYYEVTHNAGFQKTYVDHYVKIEQTVIDHNPYTTDKDTTP